MKATRALILAAGKGTRMNSDIPKVLNTIGELTFIEMVVAALSFNEIEQIGIIVSEENIDGIKEVLGDKVEYIIQKEQLGTGHAALCASDWLRNFTGNLIVVVGDAPFITQEIMRNLISFHEDNCCTLLSSIWDNPPNYGRIVRNGNNEFIRIVEEKDATEAEKLIREVNSSHYIFDSGKLFAALNQLQNSNAQNEYYLTDVIELFSINKEKVQALPIKYNWMTLGVNTEAELDIARDRGSI